MVLENTCVRDSFLIKLQVFRPTTLLKKESLAQVFSYEICKISKNTFFIEHLQTTASDLSSVLRSSRPEVFCKKGVLRNFAKFAGKHLCQTLLFNKRRLWHRCFPVNFVKFLRTPFFTEHLQWLFLYFQ